MEKVYLLLRNNVEQGPFTYTQLLSQSLVPTDLIWIEGESKSWLSPKELEQLRIKKEAKLCVPSIPAVVPNATHLPPPPKPSLILPVVKQDQKPYVTTSANRDQNTPADIHVLPGDTGIDLRIHKKGMKVVSLDQLAGAAFIALVLTTAWFGRHHLVAGKPQTISFAAPAAFVSEQSFAAKNELVQPFVDPSVINDTAVAKPVAAQIRTETATVKKSKPAVLSHPPKEPKSEEAEVKDAAPAEPKSPVVPLPDTALEKEESKLATVRPEPEQKNEMNVIKAEEPEVKKKKPLGKAIKGIFQKKDKDIQE